MSEQQEDKWRGRHITLCVFPHLSQVLVIDGRSETPNLIELSVDKILNTEFMDELKESFHRSLEIKDIVLADLASIPQQIESNIKLSVIRRIIDMIEDESDHGVREGVLGVLFFSGAILGISPSQWRRQLLEIVGDRLQKEDQDYLINRLETMVELERRAQGSDEASGETRGGAEAESSFDLKKIINGSQGGFRTLWKRESS